MAENHSVQMPPFTPNGTRLCLKWNNHQPNFISTFTTLLNTGVLLDVTLAAEGRQLQAHKLVLCACSPFFYDLIVNNPTSHPVIILKDVTYMELTILVNFMYYGEVVVSQELLPQLLQTASSLNIKGLTHVATEIETKPAPCFRNPRFSVECIPQIITEDSIPPEVIMQNDHDLCRYTGFEPETPSSTGSSEPEYIAHNPEPDPCRVFNGDLAQTPGPMVKRKRPQNPQSADNFKKALEAVRDGGIGFCKAARLFGVNNRTLWLEYRKLGYPVHRKSIRERKPVIENSGENIRISELMWLVR